MGKTVANVLPPRKMHSHPHFWTQTTTPVFLHTSWPHVRCCRQREVLGGSHLKRPHLDKSHRQHHRQGIKDTRIPPLVRPTLEYACTVWDTHYITTTRDLEKVQRRAARFTFNCYTDTTPGCVTRLIDKLGWEP